MPRSGADRIADAIGDHAADRQIPVLVVYLWSREGLIRGDVIFDECRREGAWFFVGPIGAEFLD